MKIKTVILKNAVKFDQQVNRLLAEGYMLGERRVLMTSPVLTHYAQLVQLDPEPQEQPEPQPLDDFKAMDAIEALYVVRDFCDSNQCEGCQLHDFCARHLANNEGPADWILPGEEAPKA